MRRMMGFIFFALFIFIITKPCFPTSPSDIENLVRFSDVQRLKNLICLDPDTLKPESSSQNTILHYASQMGRPDIVDLMISLKTDVNAHNRYKQTPLHFAAVSGDQAITEKLVSSGADVNARDYNGKTPLHSAAWVGDLNEVKLLVARGANINALTFPTRTSPLMCTIEKGHPEIVKYLVSKGADIKSVDCQGNLPLHLAVVNGNTDIIKLLLDSGSPVNRQNIHGETPLIKAFFFFPCSERANVPNESAILLIERGADLRGKGYNGTSLLGMASMSNSRKVVEVILSKGDEYLKIGKNKPVELLLAYIATDNVAKTGEMLEKNPKMGKFKCERGLNLLHFAAGSAGKDMIEFLVSRGFGVNSGDSENNTPLHRAAKFDNCEAVETLISLGARVNARNEYKNTPLHQAASNNSAKAAKLLIDSGAEVDAKGQNDETPLWDAIFDGNNNIEVVKVLIANGAVVIEGNDGNSPLLERASEKGNIEMMKLLLDNKVSFGKSVIRAVEKGRFDAVGFLLSKGAKVIIKQDERGNEPLSAIFTEEFYTKGKTDKTTFLIKEMLKTDKNQRLPYYPLIMAVRVGDVELVKKVLARISSDKLELKDIGINNPLVLLFICIHDNNLKLFDFLLDYGFAVTYSSTDVRNIFKEVVRFNRIDMMESLIKRGFKPDIQGILLAGAAIDGNIALYNLMKSHGAKDTFFSACATGNIEFLKFYLRACPSQIDARLDGRTQLEIAIENENDDMALFLLENGADYNQKYTTMSMNHYQNIPIIFLAVNRKCNKVVDYIIQKKIDILQKDMDNSSLLHYAALSGNLEVVELLIEKGIPIDEPNHYRFTPLVFAVLAENWKIADILISKRADLMRRAYYSGRVHKTVLSRILDPNSHKDVDGAEFLIIKNLKRFKENEVLNWSLYKGRTGPIGALLKQQLNINKEQYFESLDNYSGNSRQITGIKTTLLNAAAETGRKEIVEFAIKNGADVNRADSLGWTALNLARANGYGEIEEILIRNGAKQ